MQSDNQSLAENIVQFRGVLKKKSLSASICGTADRDLLFRRVQKIPRIINTLECEHHAGLNSVHGLVVRQSVLVDLVQGVVEHHLCVVVETVVEANGE